MHMAMTRAHPTKSLQHTYIYQIVLILHTRVQCLKRSVYLCTYCCCTAVLCPMLFEVLLP